MNQVKGRKKEFENSAGRYSFLPTTAADHRGHGGEDPDLDEKKMPKYAPNLELPKGAK